jgi:Zn finger protein HypA/HybF involved in hydrogenase expression
MVGIQGSGIGQVQIEREFNCRDCDWEGELVGSTDDYQDTLYAECPNCREELTIDLDAERNSANWDDKDEE